MRTCDGCGAAVTPDYHRVFRIRGVLHSCLHCNQKCGTHMPDTAHRTPDPSVLAGDPKDAPDPGGEYAEPTQDDGGDS